MRVGLHLAAHFGLRLQHRRPTLQIGRMEAACTTCFSPWNRYSSRCLRGGGTRKSSDWKVNMTERSNFDRRLAAYAAVATAAGVSMLASVKPADAEVVFTSSDAHLTCPVTFPIDMNNDGITDF